MTLQIKFSQYALLLSLIVMATVAFGSAEARWFRQTQIPNNEWGCAVCHVSAFGAGRRTNFGEDILRTLRGRDADWSQVCDLDSDGDGIPNKIELNDPNCNWRIGARNPGGPVTSPFEANVVEVDMAPPLEEDMMVIEPIADAGAMEEADLGEVADAGSTVDVDFAQEEDAGSMVAEDMDLPVGGEEPPVGGEEPPAGGEEPPAGGEEPPLGGEEPPAGGEEPPLGAVEPPIGRETPLEMDAGVAEGGSDSEDEGCAAATGTPQLGLLLSALALFAPRRRREAR